MLQPNMLSLTNDPSGAAQGDDGGVGDPLEPDNAATPVKRPLDCSDHDFIGSAPDGAASACAPDDGRASSTGYPQARRRRLDLGETDQAQAGSQSAAQQQRLSAGTQLSAHGAQAHIAAHTSAHMAASSNGLGERNVRPGTPHPNQQAQAHTLSASAQVASGIPSHTGLPTGAASGSGGGGGVFSGPNPARAPQPQHPSNTTKATPSMASRAYAYSGFSGTAAAVSDDPALPTPQVNPPIAHTPAPPTPTPPQQQSERGRTLERELARVAQYSGMGLFGGGNGETGMSKWECDTCAFYNEAGKVVCVICRKLNTAALAQDPSGRMIILFAQDGKPFTIKESLLRDTVDEGTPLGRILFGPHTTSLTHGSVKLQCAPAVIPVMLELLQRGYLTQDPPMHIREKLECYGLTVRISLFTRLFGNHNNSTNIVSPTQTLACSPMSRFERGALKNNDRYLFDFSALARSSPPTTVFGRYPPPSNSSFGPGGRAGKLDSPSHVHFVDFGAPGEKCRLAIPVPPEFASFPSHTVDSGEDPVLALYSPNNSRVCAIMLGEADSDGESTDTDSDAGHNSNPPPAHQHLPGSTGVTGAALGAHTHSATTTNSNNSNNRPVVREVVTDVREVDVGAIPEHVAINSRYLAVLSCGCVHVFDLCTGGKVGSFSPVQPPTLALRGDKLILQLCGDGHEGHGTCVIDIPTATVRKCYPAARSAPHNFRIETTTADAYPPGAFWRTQPHTATTNPQAHGEEDAGEGDDGVDSDLLGMLEGLAFSVEQPKYGLGLRNMGSVLLAYNADSPNDDAVAPQAVQVSGPYARTSRGVVGSYGFYCASADSQSIGLFY